MWRWFIELHRGRSAGFGANPIGWPDLEAWQRVSGARPLPHEIEWLQALDYAWLKANAPKPPKGA